MKTLNQAAIAIAVATLATVAGAQETHKLVGYLNLLDSNATARQAHEANPVNSMEKYGLTTEEQSALLSADNQLVAKTAGIEDGKFGTNKIQVVNIDDSYVDY